MKNLTSPEVASGDAPAPAPAVVAFDEPAVTELESALLHVLALHRAWRGLGDNSETLGDFAATSGDIIETQHAFRLLLGPLSSLDELRQAYAEEVERTLQYHLGESAIIEATRERPFR